MHMWSYILTLVLASLIDLIMLACGVAFSMQALLFVGALYSLYIRCKYGNMEFTFKTTGKYDVGFKTFSL